MLIFTIKSPQRMAEEASQQPKGDVAALPTDVASVDIDQFPRVPSPGFKDTIGHRPTFGNPRVLRGIDKSNEYTLSGAGIDFIALKVGIMKYVAGTQFGWTQAEVIACSYAVLQILLMPYSDDPESAPKTTQGNHLIGLKAFKWDGDWELGSLRPKGADKPSVEQIKEPMTESQDSAGTHVPDNEITRAYYREMAALILVSGLPSMQQIISMEMFTEVGMATLITRLPHGQPLRTTLQPFPDWKVTRPEYALVIFARIMAAVGEMHERKVMHNNLGQTTVVFQQQLFPTCSDFAYARQVHYTQKHHELVRVGQTGAPCFAAPESIIVRNTGTRKLGFISTKSDVYAAAAVVFHGLFITDLTIEGDTPIGWAHKVKQYAQSHHHPANQLVLDLFRRCLQPDPEMRPRAVDAVRQAERCASLIRLSHYNPDDPHGARYIGKGNDWQTYDWTADQKCYSSSLQAWHGLADDSMHC